MDSQNVEGHPWRNQHTLKHLKAKKNVVVCLDKKVNKHKAELQRTDQGTKVTGEFSTKGHIFPPNIQNGFL